MKIKPSTYHGRDPWILGKSFAYIAITINRNNSIFTFGKLYWIIFSNTNKMFTFSLNTFAIGKQHYSTSTSLSDIPSSLNSSSTIFPF